ncbi:MAG: cytochrome c-type biogenesis protein CcmH [Betaproteobacteria bacterium]|nr:MAG: cytochrome c-type biogenesis protein CcmH [Betaproteobacteria bacterium]
MTHPALASSAAPALVQAADPALEARVKQLSAELRCLVCQNQSVADSDAPVARDMRDQVRTQLAAGKSDAEVKRYMTERFGDFVLYRPPLKLTTLALWFGPFVVMIVGLWYGLRRIRMRGVATVKNTLSDADRARARELLQSGPPHRS